MVRSTNDLFSATRASTELRAPPLRGRRRIPSTTSLVAFEAAARLESFTLAAKELALTQSAVCRQIASLESLLDLKLFRRARRGVALTQAGEQYSRNVRARLDEIESDTLDALAFAQSGAVLEMGVVPSFATKWLIPRLTSFLKSHPGALVHLHSRTRPFLFEDSGLDAAIHAGDGRWPGTRSMLLMRERLIAVGAPSLLTRAGSLSHKEWLKMPLLQAATRPYAWREWFASKGMHVDRDLAGLRFELFSMLTEAAAQGLGAALVPRFLVEDELACGKLALLSDHLHDSDRGYYLICPEQRADEPAIVRFRDWLAQEAAAC